MTRHWMYWSGSNGADDAARFLRQCPGVIYWAELPLIGTPADLLITYEGSDDHPLRVPPYMWVHFDGQRFSWFERGPEEGQT